MDDSISIERQGIALAEAAQRAADEHRDALNACVVRDGNGVFMLSGDSRNRRFTDFCLQHAGA